MHFHCAHSPSPGKPRGGFGAAKDSSSSSSSSSSSGALAGGEHQQLQQKNSKLSILVASQMDITSYHFGRLEVPP